MLILYIVSLLNPTAKIGSRIISKKQELDNYNTSSPNSLQTKQPKQPNQNKKKSSGIMQLSDDEVCF